MDTDKVLIAASRRGLDFGAIRYMTVGQVIDYCIEYDNQLTRSEKNSKKDTVRKATQADIDAFFGG